MGAVSDARPTVEKIWVPTFTLTLTEARRMAHILRRAAEQEEDTDIARKLRTVAYQIVERGEGKLHVHKRPAQRPADNDAEAVGRVLRGEQPYPVLSEEDKKTAWRRLEERGVSASEIGRRLHVNARTVSRWRRMERETG